MMLVRVEMTKDFRREVTNHDDVVHLTGEFYVVPVKLARRMARAGSIVVDHIAPQPWREQSLRQLNNLIHEASLLADVEAAEATAAAEAHTRAVEAGPPLALIVRKRNEARERARTGEQP